MDWTHERTIEVDEGGNEHAVILVTTEDGTLLRYSPSYTDEELAKAVERDLAPDEE